MKIFQEMYTYDDLKGFEQETSIFETIADYFIEKSG